MSLGRAATGLLLLWSACGGGLTSATDSGGPGFPQDCPVDACMGGCTDIDADPLNCGDCGITCVVPNAEPTCDLGECGLGTCQVGWADCDGDLLNGCEAEALCDAGAPCATSCGTTGTLDCGDACAPTCEPPTETCNLADDDCDGACDEDLAGCQVDIYRSSGALGHIYGLDAAEALELGQTLEAERYFRLVVEPLPGTSALYRCDKGGGRRFLTTSARCEGLNKPPELTLGHLVGGPTCGAIPLYRMYNRGNNNHFYTTSEVERDRAVGLGFAVEGTVGFVLRGRR